MPLGHRSTMLADSFIARPSEPNTATGTFEYSLHFRPVVGDGSWELASEHGPPAYVEVELLQNILAIGKANQVRCSIIVPNDARMVRSSLVHSHSQP